MWWLLPLHPLLKYPLLPLYRCRPRHHPQRNGPNPPPCSSAMGGLSFASLSAATIGFRFGGGGGWRWGLQFWVRSLLFEVQV